LQLKGKRDLRISKDPAAFRRVAARY
jgi:hypothetical protein